MNADRPTKLSDETFAVLLAFESALPSARAFATASMLTDHASPLKTDQIAGACRWLEREGLVRRNRDLYNGRSWWGLTDAGLEVLRDSM